MFTALQSVQASEFALESSLQVAPLAPAGQFTSRHGQHHHQQKGNNNPSLDGSSCKLINFNNSSPSEEHQNFPITFPFEVQAAPQKAAAAAAPIFFGAHPDHHLSGFVVDSSADVNGGGISGRSQDSSSTRKPSNGFSTNSSDWGETAGRINFPFDLGADSSEEWRCNIPWESFLTSPAALQTELPH